MPTPPLPLKTPAQSFNHQAPTASAADVSRIYWIGAERARQHAQSRWTEVAEVFYRYGITESEYRIYAGYDEESIKSTYGCLEQIHVFVTSQSVADSELLQSLLLELAQLFTPFSARLFTQTSAYVIPVSELRNDGDISEAHELTGANFWSYIGLGENNEMPPKVISLSCSSSEPAFESSFFPGGSWNGVDDKHFGLRQEKDRNPGHTGSDTRGKYSEELGDGADKPPTISFDIVSELHFVQEQIDLQDNLQDDVFQSMSLEGELTIRTKPLDSCRPYDFATRQITFDKLKFGMTRTTSTPYKQYNINVVVNSHHKIIRVGQVKPRRTRTSDFEAEKKPYTYRTTQQSMYGVLYWGFRINSDYDQDRGADLSEAGLPSVEFEFFGSTVVPVPLPDRIDVDVLSHWTLIPRFCGEKPWLPFWSKPSKTVSYSNLCQVVGFSIPPDLPYWQKSDYKSTLHVYVGSH